ncbi:MAG TPA: enoyl-CoA hydratase-related protein [Acidimicrobiia bacterium]|nr:enoyl-CoA hydratase-related protein [Acidimicrobiia bacterium]
MTDDAYVLCDRDEHGVALVRLNRPPMNPLSQAMLAALRDVARDLASDTSVKAVVVAGSEKAFAAGADIDEFGDQAQAQVIERGFRDAFDAVESIPRPVIAAMRGYALGGGLELAMACDLRVASEKARVGQPEILLGVIPGAGGTQRLPALVGPARAKEMIWSGRQVRADEAHAIGLVDKVVHDDEVEHSALHWAAEFAKGAVVAMGLAKRVINGGRGVPLAAALDAETEAFVEVFGTEDARTGVQSFREHGPGKAKFSGR